MIDHLLNCMIFSFRFQTRHQDLFLKHFTPESNLPFSAPSLHFHFAAISYFSLTQSSCRNICSNQNVRSTIAKFSKDIIAFLLAFITMHTHCRPSVTFNVPGHIFHFLFCFHKNYSLCSKTSIVCYLLKQAVQSTIIWYFNFFLDVVKVIQ